MNAKLYFKRRKLLGIPAIKQSANLVNSIQKFRFPFTDVYLHPENRSQRY